MMNLSQAVRVRFAPSPTGFFHIGSARTALFNWLYARHTGGTFILRIEDTDLSRNTPEALKVLFEGMRWLGLDWDEGPEVGGAYGPYFQSQRNDIYKDYLEKLRASGHVYDKEGAVYFRVSGKSQVMKDVIRGEVERTEEKDFVIFRSDGTPVFHFVNVVDDIAMNITHIVRGEDHLSNTSKHQELFKAFGAPVPLFAHLPLILKTDGPGKMSKRDRGSLVEEYIQRHFLPEAVVNYLCLLGWSTKDNREILPIETLIGLFELADINKNNAHFDAQKLSHFNAIYTKNLSLDTLFEHVVSIKTLKPLVENIDAQYVKSVLSICQEKLHGLETLEPLILPFVSENFSEDEAVKEKLLKKGHVAVRLVEAKTLFESIEDFSINILESVIKGLATAQSVSPGEYMLPIRFAVSGMGAGPSLYPMLSILGKKRVVERLERVIHNF